MNPLDILLAVLLAVLLAAVGILLVASAFLPDDRDQ